MNALLASYDSESGGSEEETVDALPKQKKEKSFALPEGVSSAGKSVSRFVLFHRGSESRFVAQGDFFSNPGAVEDSSDDDSEDNECADCLTLSGRLSLLACSHVS